MTNSIFSFKNDRIISCFRLSDSGATYRWLFQSFLAIVVSLGGTTVATSLGCCADPPQDASGQDISPPSPPGPPPGRRLPPPGLPRDGRPDGRPPNQNVWLVLRDVHKQAFSSRMDFMTLLSHPAVRQEVGIDEDEYEKLRQLERDFLDDIREVSQQQRDNPVPHDEVVKKMVEVVQKHDDQFIEQFRAATNFERFIGILVQVRGNRSVVHQDVANRIDLPPDKLAEIRELTNQVWRDQVDRMGDNFRAALRRRGGERPVGRGPGDNRRDGERRGGGDLNDDRRNDDRHADEQRESLQKKNSEIRQLIEQVEKKVNHAVSLKLTTEQLQVLEKLKGPVFELSDEDSLAIRLPYFPGRPGPPPPPK